MNNLPEESKMIYDSKDVKDEETVFNALISCAASWRTYKLLLRGNLES
jgi:hypothetical protein